MVKFIKTFCYQIENINSLKDVFSILMFVFAMSSLMIFILIGNSEVLTALSVFSPILILVFSMFMTYIFFVIGLYLIGKLNKLDKELGLNSKVED